MMELQERERAARERAGLQAALRDEQRLRARAELALRDVRIAADVQREVRVAERERTAQNLGRLRRSNAELEAANAMLLDRVAHLEAELAELQATNHVYKTQIWEQSFARKQRRMCPPAVQSPTLPNGMMNAGSKIDMAMTTLPEWAWERAFAQDRSDRAYDRYQAERRARGYRRMPDTTNHHGTGSMSLPTIGLHQSQIQRSPIRVPRRGGREPDRGGSSYSGESNSDYKDDDDFADSADGGTGMDQQQQKQEQRQHHPRRKEQLRASRRQGGKSDKPVRHRTGYLKGDRAGASAHRKERKARDKRLGLNQRPVPLWGKPKGGAGQDHSDLVDPERLDAAIARLKKAKALRTMDKHQLRGFAIITASHH